MIINKRLRRGGAGRRGTGFDGTLARKDGGVGNADGGNSWARAGSKQGKDGALRLGYDHRVWRGRARTNGEGNDSVFERGCGGRACTGEADSTNADGYNGGFWLRGRWPGNGEGIWHSKGAGRQGKRRPVEQSITIRRGA